MRSGEIDGYDAIFLSPHKFVGGPGSPGILLMSKALYQLRSSPPSTCGGGTVSYVNGFNEKVYPFIFRNLLIHLIKFIKIYTIQFKIFKSKIYIKLNGTCLYIIYRMF